MDNLVIISRITPLNWPWRTLKMKKSICFIRRSFRFDGGAEAAAASYIKCLERVSDIRLICETWSGDLSKKTTSKVAKGGWSRGTKYEHFITGALQIAATNGCLIHSHEWTPGAHVLRLGDGLHSHWLDLRGTSNLWRRFDGFHRRKLRFEQEAITHPDLKFLICNSNFVKNSVIERYSVDPSKICVIRNVVTQPFKEFDPSCVQRLSRKLLFVGSGWERKGLSDAIKAFALLPNEWTFDVVGTDKAINEYKKLAERIGVENRIHFLGAFPVRPEVYAKSTVMIHAALYEPFPNVAIEALSQGLPVVSSPNSGTSDFNKSQGVWTVKKDPTELASSILNAASISEDRRCSFRKHILQFDLEYLEKELVTLYSSITNT